MVRDSRKKTLRISVQKVGVVALSEIPPRATDRESSSPDRPRDRVLVLGPTKGVLLARPREGPCCHIDRERVHVGRQRVRGSLSRYRTKDGHRPTTDRERLNVAISTEKRPSSRDRG